MPLQLHLESSTPTIQSLYGDADQDAIAWVIRSASGDVTTVVRRDGDPPSLKLGDALLGYHLYRPDLGKMVWHPLPLGGIPQRQATTLEPPLFAVLREARAIEDAAGFWAGPHVAAILGLERTSVYGIGYFRTRCIRIGRRSSRWDPKDVRAYAMLQRGRPLEQREYFLRRRSKE